MKIYVSFLLLLGCMLAGCSASKNADRNKANNRDIEIKVMSYNIHHANPPSQPGVINLDTIAAIINAQAPHLVALQEVDVRTKRSGASIDQAAYLAQKTGMQAFFAKGIDYEGGEYGVAILSKLPIQKGEKYWLPGEPGSGAEQRVLATTVVTLRNGKELLFANTHLDHRKGSPSRMLQTKEILRLLQEEKRPIILAGDLNDTPASETLQLLRTQFTSTCESCPFTIPQVAPTRTIDFILFHKNSSWQVKQHRVLPETFASDHLPIMATLQLPQ